MEYKYNIDDVVLYDNRIATVVSIDGPASASLPLSNYPMTIQFVDNTRLSVYDHQCKPIEPPQTPMTT